jgi:hypothetical protein
MWCRVPILQKKKQKDVYVCMHTLVRSEEGIDEFNWRSSSWQRMKNGKRIRTQNKDVML